MRQAWLLFSAGVGTAACNVLLGTSDPEITSGVAGTGSGGGGADAGTNTGGEGAMGTTGTGGGTTTITIDDDCYDPEWATWTPQQGPLMLEAPRGSWRVDAVTKLAWRFPASDALTWSLASTACAEDDTVPPEYSLSRVPTRIELLSLVNYSTSLPTSEPVGLSLSDKVVWTSSPVATDGSRGWAVNFDLRTAEPRTTSEAHAVVCVASILPPPMSVPSPGCRFVQASGWVYDKITDLSWSPVQAAAPHTTAVSTCQTVSNSSGELPQIWQYSTIISAANGLPALYTPMFGSADQPIPFWSATITKPFPDSAFTQNLNDGVISYSNTSLSYPFMCVKAGPPP